MPVFLRTIVIAALAAALLLPEGVAFAGLGQPSPWQIGLQEAGSPVMDDVVGFHTFVLWIITGITVFVLGLLIYVMIKFNAAANPVPSRTTHNTLVEVLWTVIPVVILVIIALPSFRILFFQLNTPPADLTIKATGVTWNWKYDYPDNGDFEFDSLMLQDKERKADQPRLLSVDNEMVVPVNKVIRMQVTGFDVIHSFTVPSFGIKIDAIPGRIERNLVQGHQGGLVLRAVFGTVWQGSCFHAHRGARGDRRRVCHLGRGGEKEVRQQRNVPDGVVTASLSAQ